MISKKLSARVYKVEVDSNLFIDSFEKALKIFYEKSLTSDVNYSKEEESYSKRYFDISKNDKEISIYRDSFEYKANFTASIFDDTICFLLAKDIKCLYENKIEGSLDNKNTEPDNIQIQPKLPTHCVYFKTSNRLIIQDGKNTTSAKEIENGIINIQGIVKIIQLKRNDVVEQIAKVASAIEKIDINDLNLAEFLPKTDREIITELMSDPDSKINLTLNITNKSDEYKEKIVDLFIKSYKKEIKKNFNNLKVSYKNSDGIQKLLI